MALQPGERSVLTAPHESPPPNLRGKRPSVELISEHIRAEVITVQHAYEPPVLTTVGSYAAHTLGCEGYLAEGFFTHRERC
jgi:hypothetical protein